jgi:Rrf2 family protein
VRISAKTDYAVRAAAELATATPGVWVRGEDIARAQGIPDSFAPSILAALRRGGLVESRRGVDGGHRLARSAAEISVADVVRAVDGPLANVAGRLVEDVSYDGAAQALRETWVALRASMRTVLEEVSLAALVSARLPDHVATLLADDESWQTREGGLVRPDSKR